MIKFVMAHAADIFGAALVFGPIVLGITLAIVSRKRRGFDPGQRSSLKVTDREIGKRPELGATYLHPFSWQPTKYEIKPPQRWGR